MRSSDVIFMLIFCLIILAPLLGGAFIAFAKNEMAASYVDRFQGWIVSKHAHFAASGSFWRKYLVASLLWPFKSIGERTQEIQDRFWKSGVRVLICGYVGLAILYVVVAIVYAAVVLALVIGGIALAIAVLFEMSGSQSTRSHSEEPRSRSGYSRRRWNVARA